MTLPDFKGTFMPTMLPAPDGTFIIELSSSGAILRTPLVAWAPDSDNPYRAPHPITVNGLERLTGGRAVLFPSGMVHDRSHPICFESIEEWRVIAEKGPRTEKPAERQPDTSNKTAPSSSASAPALKIEWATSPFKTNSFYRYTDGDLDFIFQIDGGVNPPKQKAPVEKIKRDEFMALKKTVDVAEVKDLMEGRAPGLDDIGTFDDDLLGGGDPDDDDLVGGGEEVSDDDLI